MKAHLVSTENDNYDFDISDCGTIRRVVVPADVKKGETVNMYHGESSKCSIVWHGKHGAAGYLVGDVERSLVHSEVYKQEHKQNEYIISSDAKPITTLILGANQNAHIITKRDRFLDNGVCVQLLKEHKMKVQYPGDSLVLDELSIETIKKYQSITHEQHEFKVYRDNDLEFRVFSIVDDTERFLLMAYENEDDLKERKGFFIDGFDYYRNALKEKERLSSEYYAVKIFDSDSEQVVY